jgi:hypothetical protein
LDNGVSEIMIWFGESCAGLGNKVQDVNHSNSFTKEKWKEGNCGQMAPCFIRSVATFRN